MEQSTYYQMILREGRVESRREDLLMLGTDILGEPSASERNRLDQIDNPDLLQRMVRQVVRSKSWQEILEVN